jgi:glutathione reductase (NADPH)
MAFDFDLYVIGAGSGGVRLSRMAAGLGARVAIAESSRVGGTCVIRGCVPKKLLVYASHYSEEIEDAAGFGWTIEPGKFSWETLIERKNKEIDRLNGIYLKMLADSGVTLHPARATVTGPNEVEVDGTRYTAKYIVIATGARPEMPRLPGIELALSSDEALDLPHLPARVGIVGGGYIAVEFAGIFNGVASNVDLLVRGPRILRGFDEEVRAFAENEIRKKGVTIDTHTEVTALEKKSDGSIAATLGDGTQRLYDCVLYATGRAPNTAGLGLEKLGIELDKHGAVPVDNYAATSVPSIFAIGDVTDRIQLTPVAIHEGSALARTLFGGERVGANHENVPSAVFCQPEIATVGLTEEQARQRFGELDVYRTSFKSMRHTLSGRDERNFMKLIVDRASQRVVAAHMVGRDAAEIIQGIAIAVRMGATKAQFDQTVGIHPTAAEEFVTMRTPS